MKKTIILTLIFITMTGFNAHAQFNRKEVFNVITNVNRIETGRIGESGEVSKVAIVFIELLNSGSAKSNLIELFKQSKSDASRLYALTGLWKVDRSQYEILVHEVDLNHEVEALWFGVKRKETVSIWLDVIKKGEMLEAITWKPAP
jgi:hypothetical protein